MENEKFETILISALKLPAVRVDRKTFLKDTLLALFFAVIPKILCTFVVWNEYALFITIWNNKKDWLFWVQPDR